MGREPPCVMRPKMRALDELFPDAAGIFSVKPLVGHCQSAAAAVETLATIYSFQTGFVPAPPQVAPGHPKLVNGRTPRMPGLVMKSSLGLGGLQHGHGHRRTRRVALELR